MEIILLTIIIRKLFLHYFTIYSWMLDLFKIVLKRDIEINDLYIPLDEHTSSTLGNDLEK